MKNKKLKIVLGILLSSIVFLGAGCPEAERTCAQHNDRGTAKFNDCVAALIEWEIMTRQP